MITWRNNDNDSKEAEITAIATKVERDEQSSSVLPDEVAADTETTMNEETQQEPGKDNQEHASEADDEAVKDDNDKNEETKEDDIEDGDYKDDDDDLNEIDEQKDTKESLEYSVVIKKDEKKKKKKKSKAKKILGKKINLCKLVKRDFHRKHQEEYIALVLEPRYLCRKCGRTAHSKKVLCNPVRIAEE